MIYYDFKDYEGFKELFGIVEHGNGVKSRKNKILLALYKERNALRAHIRVKENNSLYRTLCHLDDRRNKAYYKDDRHYDAMCAVYERMKRALRIARDNEPFCGCDLLEYTDLPALKSRILYELSNRDLRKIGAYNVLNLNGCTMYSDSYRTDDMDGLCEDGTLNAVRYHNIEKDRVFKMKAGRMFNHILSCNVLTDALPEQIKRWLSEEWVAEWIEYARENIGSTEYKLHVDDNFEGIYDPDCCAGYDDDSNSFGSCMVGDGQWSFYQDSVDAKAAYLTDADGMIVARCIVFTDVKDQDGKVWRLAERQYSKYSRPNLQRQLVFALIREGHIDGYKAVGASCHDAQKFVDNAGNSLSDRKFRIRCSLHDGDTLSYQDSFKWYDPETEIADNFGYGPCGLDTTDSEFGGPDNHDHDRWSEYNNEYIPEDDAYSAYGRGDYFWSHQICYALVFNRTTGRFSHEDCFVEDCLKIDGDCYYAGDNGEDAEYYGISQCPQCGEYMVVGRSNTYYSEVTDEDYCCSDCMDEAEQAWYTDNGWVQASYDGSWHEDPDDVISAKHWWYNSYHEETISVEQFNWLVEEGRATEYCGTYYIDNVLMDGEPVHPSHAVRVAA